MHSTAKTAIFWVFVLICLTLLWSAVNKSATLGKDTEVPYSALLNNVQQGQLLDATIEGTELRGRLKASPASEFHTTLPVNNQEIVKAMLAAQVSLTIHEPRQNPIRLLLINLGGPAVLLLLAVAVIPPFWTIFRKAGFSPLLSLLVVLPLINLLLLYTFAYSRWKPASPNHA